MDDFLLGWLRDKHSEEDEATAASTRRVDCLGQAVRWMHKMKLRRPRRLWTTCTRMEWSRPEPRGREQLQVRHDSQEEGLAHERRRVEDEGAVGGS